MPISIRLPLASQTGAYPHQHATGLRALVLRWLEAADPLLSAAIHEDRGIKPYCITPLWREGDGFYFDVALLEDSLLAPLAAGLRICGQEIRLGPQRFRVLEPGVVASTSWENLLFAAQGGPSL